MELILCRVVESSCLLTHRIVHTFLGMTFHVIGPRRNCEGDGDVVGVVTPLVRGGAQVLHGDQVVELSVPLEVQEREEKGEDGEGQIEVEEAERWTQGETHMYMDDMTGLRTWATRCMWPNTKCVTKCALAFMLRCCAFCACSCSCHCTCCWCGLSHACPQCSCRSSCCIYSVSVASFV